MLNADPQTPLAVTPDGDQLIQRLYGETMIHVEDALLFNDYDITYEARATSRRCAAIAPFTMSATYGTFFITGTNYMRC